MPKKYHIPTKKTPSRFLPVPKLVAFERDGCLGCLACVKRSSCVYDAYRTRAFDPARVEDSLDARCLGCMRCVQECKKGILARAPNPARGRIGDDYWTPGLIASLWNQAETGAIPVSGCGYQGAFTGPVGCYTTQTLIKKANRLSENRLADTEYASVLAMRLAGHPYPADRLLEGWRHTLFSHFHDILPGSGVHDTRTYTHGLFQEIMAITGTAETDALRRVAALVDTRLPGWPALEIQPAWIDRSGFGAGVGFASVNGGVPRSRPKTRHRPASIRIFNPTPRDRHEVIEVTIWDNGEPGNANWKTKHFVAHASDGTVVPAQQIKSGRYWTHEYLTLSFPVTVPGFGYARYVVTEADKPATEPEPVARQIGFTHHCSYAPVERSIEGLENGDRPGHHRPSSGTPCNRCLPNAARRYLLVSCR